MHRSVYQSRPTESMNMFQSTRTTVNVTAWLPGNVSCAHVPTWLLAAGDSVATSASADAVLAFCSWIGFLIYSFSLHGTQGEANWHKLLNLSALTFHPGPPPSAVQTAFHGRFSALNDAFYAINIWLFLKRKEAQVHASMLQFPGPICHLPCMETATCIYETKKRRNKLCGPHSFSF